MALHFIQHFNFFCTSSHNNCLWLHDIAFVSHVLASYTVLLHSCFCSFFFPSSYAISLSSSNSVSLVTALSRKSPLQSPQYLLSNFFKFHLFPYIQYSSPPVVFCQAAFYKRL